jgi:hypothetical protein
MDESETADFIMINTPVGFGADSREFMDFAKAVSQQHSMVAAVTSAIIHPSTRTAIHNSLKTSLTRSLTQLQYWGGTPYRLGPDQVMKFTVAPEGCPGAQTQTVTLGPKFGANKFRADLYRQAEAGFCLGLYVQLQSPDVRKTPIEDTSIEWPRDVSPPMRVALVKFFPQKYADAERASLESMCTKMSYNPWHTIEEHRPLGNQNRARLWVYDASRAHRAGGAAQNPLGDREWDFK